MNSHHIFFDQLDKSYEMLNFDEIRLLLQTLNLTTVRSLNALWNKQYKAHTFLAITQVVNPFNRNYK